MIATKVTSALLLDACFNHKNLNFLLMSKRPCLGHFSAGELNVI